MPVIIVTLENAWLHVPDIDIQVSSTIDSPNSLDGIIDDRAEGSTFMMMSLRFSLNVMST